MKFYYDGKLVRTSKTHVYSHAVLWAGEVVACSGSYELARKELASRISRLESSNNNCKLAVAAIERGDRFYWAKEKCGRGWNSYRVKIEWSKEKYLEIIAANEETKKKYEIVELEAR